MTHPLDDARFRRAPLATRAIPGTGLETVVTLQDEMTLAAGAGGAASDGGIAVTVRYIPDHQALPPAGLRAYLDLLASREWDGLEALVAVMVGDLDSEILPYWVQVRLERRTAPLYRVVAERRRPDWDNRLLLARLLID